MLQSVPNCSDATVITCYYSESVRLSKPVKSVGDGCEA
jgi:hypothetical protein